MKTKMKVVALTVLKVLGGLVAVPVTLLLLFPIAALFTGLLVFIEELANDYGYVLRSIRDQPREHKRVMWVPIGTVGEIYWYLANRERVHEAFPEARERAGAKR